MAGPIRAALAAFDAETAAELALLLALTAKVEASADFTQAILADTSAALALLLAETAKVDAEFSDASELEAELLAETAAADAMLAADVAICS